MLPTRVLRQYAPMIKFKGKHTPPASLDHAPQTHPASPSSSLPDSFASYRSKAQQHGPLAGNTTRHLSAAGQSQIAYGHVGSRSGHDLGSVSAPQGMVFDRNDLPSRFGRMRWTQAEMEAVESGGASMW